MALLKLRAAPFILIEDDSTKNTLPLLLELAQYEKDTINFFSYEQPISSWKEVFRNQSTVKFYEEFEPDLYDEYTSTKCSIVIDSVNQMVLSLGWKETLKNVRKLQKNANIIQLIIVLHKDCLSHSSKLQAHLNHIANAVVSYDNRDNTKISVVLKKGGKVFKSQEILSYDSSTRTLKSIPIINESKVVEEPPVQVLPSNLTTFKIEMEQGEKLEKYKLKLPYMSKINEGEGKVFYEPDAVDDWDEEDPDEDLDI